MVSPPIADITGIRAKLRRAEEHRSTLETELSSWSKKHTDRCDFHIRHDGCWYIVVADPLPQPDIRFSVVAGDIVYNLRSALDHLIYQLVLRDGHEPSWRNEFPIYDSEVSFLNEVKFRKRKPELSVLYGIAVDGDSWAIIEAAQPYNCISVERSPIRIIKRLSNMDKHRTLQIYVPIVEQISEAIAWNPNALLLEECPRNLQGLPLSLEEPTEIVRYRFSEYPDPNVHVKGRLPIHPTFGEGDNKGGIGCQVNIWYFRGLIEAVTQIVDEIGRLLRVIDTSGHQNPQNCR